MAAALKSSPVPCPREEGEAQSSLQVLQREPSPRALWGWHIVPPSARRGDVGIPEFLMSEAIHFVDLPAGQKVGAMPGSLSAWC